MTVITNEVLEYKYKEKYSNVSLEEASKYYYGEENAKDRLLEEMQTVLECVKEQFDELKENYEEPHVLMFINQDNLEVVYSMANYDEEYDEWIESEEIINHYVGKYMMEALVLMQMMNDNEKSAEELDQLIIEWLENLDFGEIKNYGLSVRDEWDMIDY